MCVCVRLQVAELLDSTFVTKCAPNIAALVVAGCGDLKQDLLNSALFNPQLRPIVAAVLDVAYGGDSGFRQAVDMSASALGDVALAKERAILRDLFTHVDTQPELCAFGVRECATALVDLAAVKRLVVWEDLDAVRFRVSGEEGREDVLVLTPPQAKVCAGLADDGKILGQEPWVDWLAREGPGLGVHVCFVTDRSMEGTQLVRGFGGVAAILTHPVVDLHELEAAAADADEADDDTDDLFDM